MSDLSDFIINQVYQNNQFKIMVQAFYVASGRNAIVHGCACPGRNDSGSHTGTGEKLISFLGRDISILSNVHIRISWS